MNTFWNKVFILIVARACGCQVGVMNQKDFQAMLREQLSLSQSKNPAYSMRAFAKRLDMGLGTISEVLAGKRKLSVKSARKIMDRLGLGPNQQAKVLKSPRVQSSFGTSQLAADQYFILSEWYYVALLNLLRTRDFEPNAAHIAKRLGIQLRTAKIALNRLMRVGMIRVENKKWVRVQVAFQTTEGVPNPAIRKAHVQTLDQAKRALECDPFETFDLSSLTFAFSPEDLNEAKAAIREFQDEFAERFSTSKAPTEVYRLAMQLFSLTQKEGIND